MKMDMAFLVSAAVRAVDTPQRREKAWRHQTPAEADITGILEQADREHADGLLFDDRVPDPEPDEDAAPSEGHESLPRSDAESNALDEPCNACGVSCESGWPTAEQFGRGDQGVTRRGMHTKKKEKNEKMERRGNGPAQAPGPEQGRGDHAEDPRGQEHRPFLGLLPARGPAVAAGARSASLEVEQAARSEPGKEGTPPDQQRLIFEAEQEHADGDMQAKVQVEAAGMQPDQQSRICASERHADQQCLTIAGKRLELEGMLAWEDVAEGTGEEGIPPDQQGLTAAVKQLDVDEKGTPPDQQGLTMAGQRLELEEMLAHADRQLAEGIRPNQQRAIFEGDQLQSKKVIPPDQQGLSFAGEQLEADRILNIAGKQPKLEEMLAYADMRLVEDVQPNLQRIIFVGEQLQQKKAKEGIPPTSMRAANSRRRATSTTRWRGWRRSCRRLRPAWAQLPRWPFLTASGQVYLDAGEATRPAAPRELAHVYGCMQALQVEAEAQGVAGLQGATLPCVQDGSKTRARAGR